MPVDFLVIFTTSFLGGVINSVAGGGTLLAFPALVWLGRDPIVANMTNTVGLWPASFGAMIGYRRELAAVRPWIRILLVPSFAGGIVGAILLLRTPPATFARIVPYLILFATLLFGIGDRLRRHTAATAPATVAAAGSGPWWAAIGFQFLVSVYGGYFGAGIGILMLAALALFGLQDMHEMNGIKNTLGVFINGIAAVYFSISGRVSWPDAAIMALGASLGGFGGAGLARVLGQEFVRRAVVAIGLGMTVSLLVR